MPFETIALEDARIGDIIEFYSPSMLIKHDLAVLTAGEGIDDVGAKIIAPMAGGCAKSRWLHPMWRTVAIRAWRVRPVVAPKPVLVYSLTMEQFVAMREALAVTANDKRLNPKTRELVNFALAATHTTTPKVQYMEARHG